MRPLDVYDISGARPRQTDGNPKMGDHWYWCRHHKRAEHVGWAMIGCVRVGPFMSQREALRLAVGSHNQDEGLGMDIEPDE